AAGIDREPAAVAESGVRTAPASSLFPGKPILSARWHRFDFSWMNPLWLPARHAARPGKAGSGRRSATGAGQKCLDGIDIPADRATQAQRLRKTRGLGPAPPGRAADLVLGAALRCGGAGARNRQIHAKRVEGSLVGHDSQAPCTASPWVVGSAHCRASNRTIAEQIRQFQPVTQAIFWLTFPLSATENR